MDGKNPVRNSAGVTLIELMVTLTVVLIVVAGVYGAYTQMHKNYLAQEVKADLQQNARNTLDLISRELMMAGYYGRVYEAASNAVEFSERMGGNTTSTRIRYLLSGTNLMRYEKADNSAFIPPATTGWTSNTVIAEHVNAISFAYYDRDNNQLSPLPVTDDLTLKTIRHIVVQVTMESAKPDPTNLDPITKQPRRRVTVVKADLWPRNLAEGEVPFDDDPPTEPSALEVIDNRDCNSLQLKWAPSPDADLAGYYIEYATEPGVPPIGAASVPLNQPGFNSASPEYKLTGLISTLYTKRTTEFTKYYITVRAYDNSMNYSDPTVEVSGPSDLNTDITSFGSGSDTVLNPDVPVAPTDLRNFNRDDDPAIGDDRIKLTWTASPGATVGYRLYRSETPFTSFPISGNYLVASESASLTASVIGPSDTSFIDTVPLSCKDYYYAICPVNCDNTLIHGDASHDPLYTASQYALTDGDLTAADIQGVRAKDVDGPGEPDLSGTKGGYKRIYVNLTNPILAGDSPPPPINPDFTHTLVYFKAGATEPVYNTDGSPIGGHLVYDSNSAPPEEGKFVTPGSGNSFVFNSAIENLNDFDPPDLGMGDMFWFVAVAYDRCGNRSTVSNLAQTLATLCGDDPIGHPDSPTVSADGCGDVMNLYWNWAPVEQIDLQGYRVFRNNTESFPADSEITTIPQWRIDWADATIQDGGTYFYCVRATDCLWERIEGDEPPNYNYADVKANNISPCTAESTVGPIYPGRLRRYTSTMSNPTPTGDDVYNFVTSMGISPSEFASGTPTADFTETWRHNAVRFYIQNTSAGNIEINEIKLKWGNSAAYLKGIRIGGSPASSAIIEDKVLPAPIPSATAALGTTMTALLSETDSKALDTTTFSKAIPVVLLFTNSDGSVSSATDMREEQIEVEIKYTNISTGKTDCKLFMDVLHGNPISVPLGPTLFYGTHGLGESPWWTVAFDVPGNTTPVHAVTDVHPENIGGVTTWASANISDNELFNYYDSTSKQIVTGSVGINSSLDDTATPARRTTLYYAATADKTATSPAGLEFQELDPNSVWSSDWYLDGTIPALDGMRVWYYYVVESNTGNKDRLPEIQHGYFMYDQAEFDVCNMTPMAPQNLMYTMGKMFWDEVMSYDNGTPLHYTDSITYDVFKKEGFTGTYSILASGVPYPSMDGYQDPNALMTHTFYKVRANNACTDPTLGLSDFSNEVAVCFGGAAGCGVVVSPATVKIYNNWTVGGEWGSWGMVDLTVYICDRAGDGSVWDPSDGYDSQSDITLTITSALAVETQQVTLYEVDGDSGKFKRPESMYVSGIASIYGDANDPGKIIQGATKKTAPSDVVTFKIDTGITGCSQESATLTVTTDPCSSAPNAPGGLTGSRSGKNINLSWASPTRNNDSSTPIDLKGYIVYANNETLHPAPNQMYYPAASTAAPDVNASFQVDSSQNTYTFYVVAVGNCEWSDESLPSAVITKY